MTTTFTFAPTATAPYLFQPVLDGQTYNATVLWNMFGQRWYIRLTDLGGNLIFMLPIIGSSPTLPLASLQWQNGTVTATTQNPHTFTIGTIVNLTVSGVAPSGYNGLFGCLITGPDTFTYSLSSDPNPSITDLSGINSAIIPGQYSFDVNIADGYFSTSTLVYRAQSGQFEVNP